MDTKADNNPDSIICRIESSSDERSEENILNVLEFLLQGVESEESN